MSFNINVNEGTLFRDGVSLSLQINCKLIDVSVQQVSEIRCLWLLPSTFQNINFLHQIN